MFRKYIFLTLLVIVAAIAIRLFLDWRQITDLPDQTGIRTSAGVGGFVDLVSDANGEFRVEGWGGDLRAKIPAVSAHVYIDSKAVMTIGVSVPRSDIVVALKSQSMEISGFGGSMPRAEIGSLAGAHIRVFVRMSDGRYGELRQPDAVRNAIAGLK